MAGTDGAERARRAHTAAEDDLHGRIALFVKAYRLAGGDPSATQAAVLSAFPAAGPGDYAIGLMLANRADRSRS